MGFLSFMGHRTLAIFLVIVAITLFLTGGFINSKLLVVLAIFVAIASVYFFKTQHT